jgi:hypothetical protein
LKIGGSLSPTAGAALMSETKRKKPEKNVSVQTENSQVRKKLLAARLPAAVRLLGASQSRTLFKFRKSSPFKRKNHEFMDKLEFFQIIS